MLVIGRSTSSIAALAAQTAVSVVAAAADIDLPADARFDAVVLADPVGAATPDGSVGWVRARLRPRGRLVLAADNALGLPNLASGRETTEMPGLPSLEGRPRPDGGLLPTRASLSAVLSGLGLTVQDWWFLFPNRLMPLTLLAERGLAGPGGFDPGALAAGAAALDPNGKGGPFSQRRAWMRIAEAGLLGDLAPAFAVVASDASLPHDPRLALHIGLRRRPEFERVVAFETNGPGLRVTRTPLHPGLPNAVEGVSNLFPSEPFVTGRTWQAGLDDLLCRDGWRADGIAAWAATWRDAVSHLFADGARLHPDTRLPGRALDAIPKNLIVGKAVGFIDLEWHWERPLDAGHLAVRALANALGDADVLGMPDGPAPSLLDLLHSVLPALGLPLDDAALAERLARESRFQSIVSGRATERGLDWAAETRLAPRASTRHAVGRQGVRDERGSERTEADRLLMENEALRAQLATERSAHEEAEAEAARRVDRVVAYAAELDRDRTRLEAALSDATRASERPDSAPPSVAGRTPARRAPAGALARQREALSRLARRLLSGGP